MPEAQLPVLNHEINVWGYKNGELSIQMKTDDNAAWGFEVWAVVNGEDFIVKIREVLAQPEDLDN